MKNFKGNSFRDFFRANSKTRYRLYKSGKTWLAAGVATLAGIFGGGLIGTSTVKAETTVGAAKQVGQQDVLATRDKDTIPADAALQSTSTSASASASASTSASVSASASTSASASASASSSASASTSLSLSASGVSADNQQPVKMMRAFAAPGSAAATSTKRPRNK